MFDYCGELQASLSDYRDLLEKVIREMFPKAQMIVRVHQTKAMRVPRISISIIDGPSPTDLVKAIPMLSELRLRTRWAYRGKILPRLGYSVRTKARSPQYIRAQEIWKMLEEEFGSSRFIEYRKGSRRWNPALVRQVEERMSAAGRLNHPVQHSPTLALLCQGHDANIERIAVGQRRDYLEQAALQAPTKGLGQQQAPRRNRL